MNCSDTVYFTRSPCTLPLGSDEAAVLRLGITALSSLFHTVTYLAGFQQGCPYPHPHTLYFLEKANLRPHRFRPEQLRAKMILFAFGNALAQARLLYGVSLQKSIELPSLVLVSYLKVTVQRKSMGMPGFVGWEMWCPFTLQVSPAQGCWCLPGPAICLNYFHPVVHRSWVLPQPHGEATQHAQCYLAGSDGERPGARCGQN